MSLRVEVVGVLTASLGAFAVAMAFPPEHFGQPFGPLLATTAVTGVLVTLIVRTSLLRRATTSSSRCLNSRPVSIMLALSVPITALALVMTTLWTVLPGTTSYGLPTMRTWRVLKSDLGAARPTLSHLAPVTALPGIVVLFALLCGVAAGLTCFLASAPWNHRDDTTPSVSALGLIPTLALLVWSFLGIPVSVALAIAAVYIVLAAVTLKWAWPDRLPRTQRATGIDALSVYAITTVALIAAVGIASSSTPLSPPGRFSHNIRRTTNAPIRELSLSTSLNELQRRDPNQIMFTAQSRFPTYWQVATLTEFVNGQWVPDPATQAAFNGHLRAFGTSLLPAVPSRPGGTARRPPTYSVHVSIAALYGHLLPVPPNTVSLTSTQHAKLTSVGAITASMKPGDRYAATFVEPPAPTGGGRPSGMPISHLLRYLYLPSPPRSIAAFAAEATVSGGSPLAKAEELVNWFRSGRFHYSINASVPTGSRYSSWISFLSKDRTGNCVDFASAFAILARSLGLPTRIAVGFTAGQRYSAGTVAITGSDAHEWPQVYLGEHNGWVSFEPTPSLPTSQLAPNEIVGPTGITLPVSTTAPTTQTAPTTPTTLVSPSPHSAATTTPHIRHPWTPTVLTVVAIVGSLAVLAATVETARRRRRRRSMNALFENDPARYLASQWGDLERTLERAGATRPAFESPCSHLRQLQLELSTNSPTRQTQEVRVALSDAIHVAALLELTTYSPHQLSSSEVSSCTTGLSRSCRTLSKRSSQGLITSLLSKPHPYEG